MSRKKLSFFSIVLLFLGICMLLLYMKISKMRLGSEGISSEIANASKEFKEQVGYRETQAKILLPYLKVGMHKEDIVSLLGEPDSKTDSEYYEQINYIVGRSNMINVFLDEDEKVIHMDSIWSEYSSPIERVWPLLRTGMIKQDVAIRLGRPQKELKNGEQWQYQYRDEPTIFTITFDGNDKVVKLEKE